MPGTPASTRGAGDSECPREHSSAEVRVWARLCFPGCVCVCVRRAGVRVRESLCARVSLCSMCCVCGRVGGCLCVRSRAYVVYGRGGGGDGDGNGVAVGGGAAASAVGLGGCGTVGYFFLSDSKSESQLYEICAMSRPAVR